MILIEIAFGFGLNFLHCVLLGFVDCFVFDSATRNSVRLARSSTAAFGRGSFEIEWLTVGCYTNVLNWICVRLRL